MEIGTGLGLIGVGIGFGLFWLGMGIAELGKQMGRTQDNE